MSRNCCHNECCNVDRRCSSRMDSRNNNGSNLNSRSNKSNKTRNGACTCRDSSGSGKRPAKRSEKNGNENNGNENNANGSRCKPIVSFDTMEACMSLAKRFISAPKEKSGKKFEKSNLIGSYLTNNNNKNNINNGKNTNPKQIKNQQNYRYQDGNSGKKRKMEVINEEEEDEDECVCDCHDSDDDSSTKIQETCSAFLTIIHDTVLETVEKSIECMLCEFFSKIVDRIEGLTTQVMQNECLISKMYLDILDKITQHSDKNIRQFQNLCKFLSAVDKSTASPCFEEESSKSKCNCKSRQGSTSNIDSSGTTSPSVTPPNSRGTTSPSVTPTNSRGTTSPSVTPPNSPTTTPPIRKIRKCCPKCTCNLADPIQQLESGNQTISKDSVDRIGHTMTAEVEYPTVFRPQTSQISVQNIRRSGEFGSSSSNYSISRKSK